MKYKPQIFFNILFKIQIFGFSQMTGIIFTLLVNPIFNTEKCIE